MKSVSINKLARFSAMCLACAIVVTNINPSFAQSTDRDNPTPLTTNILSMKGEKGGEDRKIYYYKLTPKSGKIKITLDSECKTNSASVTIKVQNPDGKTLNDLVGVPTGGKPHRTVKTIELPSNTPTILEISTWGFSPIYRIKIDGDWTELASASTPPAQVTVVPTPTKPELTSTSTSARNLSGVYKCNDGGTYYVRQNGNSLWWYGESGDGVGWTNIFKGTIQGNDINGNWIDVPKGNNQGAGVMNLRVSNSKFISTYKTGGFSGSEWTRK
jgi:hypothetical protein